jgi:hypothetical protein
MTTEYPSEKKIPICKEHTWLYMKTIEDKKKKRIAYMIYCPMCWQKSLHIPDISEQEMLKLGFEELERRKRKI